MHGAGDGVVCIRDACLPRIVRAGGGLAGARHSFAGEKSAAGGGHSAGRVWSGFRAGAVDGYRGSHRRSIERVVVVECNGAFISKSIFVDIGSGIVGRGFVLVAGAGKTVHHQAQAIISWRRARAAGSISQAAFWRGYFWRGRFLPHFAHSYASRMLSPSHGAPRAASIAVGYTRCTTCFMPGPRI